MCSRSCWTRFEYTRLSIAAVVFVFDILSSTVHSCVCLLNVPWSTVGFFGDLCSTHPSFLLKLS